MTIDKAISILHNFQVWRRGGNTPMPDPKEIGKAIDYALHILRYIRRIYDKFF